MPLSPLARARRPGRLLFDSLCAWPVSDLDVWQVMLRLNTPYLAPPGGAPAAHAAAAGPGARGRPPAVVTCSHFLPHPGLPSARGVPELRKAVGCAALLAQLAALGSAAHVFGHTHINGAWALEEPGGGGGGGGRGRLYVQHALEAACAAAPRGGPPPGIARVFDGEAVGYALCNVASGRPL